METDLAVHYLHELFSQTICYYHDKQLSEVKTLKHSMPEEAKSFASTTNICIY